MGRGATVTWNINKLTWQSGSQDSQGPLTPFIWIAGIFITGDNFRVQYDKKVASHWFTAPDGSTIDFHSLIETHETARDLLGNPPAVTYHNLGDQQVVPGQALSIGWRMSKHISPIPVDPYISSGVLKQDRPMEFSPAFALVCLVQRAGAGAYLEQMEMVGYDALIEGLAVALDNNILSGSIYDLINPQAAISAIPTDAISAGIRQRIRGAEQSELIKDNSITLVAPVGQLFALYYGLAAAFAARSTDDEIGLAFVFGKIPNYEGTYDYATTLTGAYGSWLLNLSLDFKWDGCRSRFA